jgi:hypothetical protein
MILRVLIRALAHLVPAIRRADWRERWSGELWSAADQKISGWRLAPGMLLDGLVEFRHGFDEGWTMSGLVGDCRLACRRAIRTPLSSCLLVGVTAVGASASSTLFSLVDVTLFRAPAQVVAPEELIQIGRGDARTFDNFSYPAYQAFRDGLRGTVDVAAYANATVLVGEGADRRQVRGQWVSSSYFAVLGTPLVRDAGLTDDSPGVVVADWFWKEYRSAIEAAGMALVTMCGCSGSRRPVSPACTSARTHPHSGERLRCQTALPTFSSSGTTRGCGSSAAGYRRSLGAHRPRCSRPERQSPPCTLASDTAPVPAAL